MAKYYVDWEQVEKEDTPALVETVARYLSSVTNPDCGVIMAILGIKIEEGKR